MMRPWRAFIMPRMTARDRRNTALRLVSMTASHSSSFMRRARLSRVMPALLTRMETAPNFFSISPISASHDSGVGDVQHCAPARDAGRVQRLLDVGRAGLAGRGTDHGRTLGAEFQRDGAADAARCPGHQCDLSFQQRGHCTPAKACFQRRRVSQCRPLQGTLDALGQAGQNLARAALEDMGDALAAM